jgi:glycosyltransferase involved in cell wall biosynthesis
MKILIVEEALKGEKGHWPEYIRTLADGFREAGDQVDVLTHRDAEESVIQRVKGTPWMQRSCWDDPRSQGRVGGLLHNLHFFRDIKRFLKNGNDYDWILCLTIRRQHLFGIWKLGRFLAKSGARTRILMLFVQGFSDQPPRGGQFKFPESVSNKLARLAFRWMSPDAKNGRIVLATEARGMKSEVEAFSGLPATLFPHPVDSALGPNRKTDPERPPLLLCPGFARYEKGSDILQEALLSLLENNPDFPCRVLVQWTDPFQLPNGEHCQPSPLLKQHEQIILLDHPISPEEYAHLVEQAAGFVLPYRDSYYARVSRVAIEAATCGIPLLYSRGTWNAELVETGKAAGLAMDDLSVESLVKGIKTFQDSLPQLSLKALPLASPSRDYFSAATFRAILAKLTPTYTDN